MFCADDWDVIALGGITTAYGSIRQIVALARETCPRAVIVLGGGVLTSLPHEMMTWLSGVDVGVIGEGFITFPEILEMIDAGQRDWPKIPGTVSRRADGGLAFAPQRQLLEDLDSLPYPAWDLFPLEEVYFKNSELMGSPEGMTSKRRLDINSSYGCSLICRYCYHLGISGDMRYETQTNGDVKVVFDEPGKYTRSIRHHSPKYIVDLVKHVYDKYQIDYLSFLDENLMTMDRYSRGVWLSEICRLWHDYGLAPQKRQDGTWSGVYWSGTSHATLCNPKILRTMAEAGCTALIYGYESFASHVMKTIGKGATPETNIRSFFWTLEAGIRPLPNQIIGFPNEDFDAIRQNMAMWDDLGIVVWPHFATPYPGSEWFTMYRERIIEQYNGNLEEFILDLGDASKVSATISHNFNAVELVGIRDAMTSKSHRIIDNYENIWRKTHNIENGQPSTLYPGSYWDNSEDKVKGGA